jgi:2-haloacid dehalogenase
MAGDRWATFDCYGTLIDWMGGMRMVLEDLFPDHDATELLYRYHDIEPTLQERRGVAYRQVLTEGLSLLAEREGLVLADEERTALADSLPSWPPFEEVPSALTEVRGRGWKLGILSNTDPDYLDASLDLIGVPTDVRIAASEIGSYKPAHVHWTTFFERTGADRDRHVHVAASLFHDIAPADELGLRAVWINRMHETSDLHRAAELPDLSKLPETLDDLMSD